MSILQQAPNGSILPCNLGSRHLDLCITGHYNKEVKIGILLPYYFLHRNIKNHYLLMFVKKDLGIEIL
jgi:hypothetical protein